MNAIARARPTQNPKDIKSTSMGDKKLAMGNTKEADSAVTHYTLDGFWP